MAKRSGVTEKISISLARSDLAALRRRAKRLYGGNVSAVIVELAADAALLEGMHLLVEQLGGSSLTDEERDRLDHERTKTVPPTRRRKRERGKAA
jgi:hypothetical protein